MDGDRAGCGRPGISVVSFEAVAVLRQGSGGYDVAGSSYKTKLGYMSESEEGAAEDRGPSPTPGEAADRPGLRASLQSQAAAARRRPGFHRGLAQHGAGAADASSAVQPGHLRGRPGPVQPGEVCQGDVGLLVLLTEGTPFLAAVWSGCHACSICALGDELIDFKVSVRCLQLP